MEPVSIPDTPENKQMTTKKAVNKAARKPAKKAVNGKLSASDLRGPGNTSAKTVQIAVRITEPEYQKVLQAAKTKGHPTVAAHLRAVLGV